MPRAGVVLWQAVALAAVLASVGAALAAPEEMLRYLERADGVRFGPARFIAAGIAALTAGIIVIRLIVITIKLGLDTRRRRERHRQLLDLLQTPNADERRVQVLAGPIPMAYCVPGRRLSAGRVVLTDSTVDLLSQPQVDAVIDHERGHLRARHDLVREAFTALHVAFPTVVRSRAALAAVDHLLEVLADDGAAISNDRNELAGALENLSPTDHSVQRRVRRLRTEPMAASPRVALSLATFALAIAVLAVPTIVLVWPWLDRAARTALGG